MFRGFGVVEAFESLPPSVVAGLVVVTVFGSGVVIATGLLALYFYGPVSRPRVEAVGLLWLFGVGARTVLKHLFALPRPSVTPIDPETLSAGRELVYVLAVDAHGYAFPSGHATNATIAFLGLAWAFNRPKGYLIGAVGAIAVGLSRVGLGAHYFGDVLAGFALGLVVLAGGLWLFTRMQRVFVPLTLVGIVMSAAVSLVLTNLSPRAIAYTVVALAGWVAWRRSDRRSQLRR